jgi:hypothetical protein
MDSEIEDFEDNMCNMSDYDEDYNEEEYDENATKSIASTIDDFVERTPVNRIRAFREKIGEMRSSWIGTLFLLVVIFSLVLSLFYWDETKNAIYTYYAYFVLPTETSRLTNDT